MRSLIATPRFYRLAREGSWIVAGQITAVLGALVLVRVLTEYLEPAQYGQLALSLTLGVLVCQVSMSGVLPGIMRFYAIAVEKGDLSGYLKASKRIMGYGTLATLVFGVLLILGTQLTGQVDWLSLIALTIVLSQLESYNSALNSIQNAARQRPVVALHSGITSWLKLAFALGFLHWLGTSGVTVVAGYIVAMLVILSSQIFFLRRLVQFSTDDDDSEFCQWMQQMWHYSKPFTIFNLFTWAQASSDRWALETFANTAEVGHFAVLMQLGYTPIAMVIALLTTFIGPILHQRSGDATDQSRNVNVHRISWQLTLFCLLITLIAFLLALGTHEWIFGILTAPDYRSVSYLLPWVLLAGGLFAAGQVLALKLMSDMNAAALIWPKLTTAIIGVGLNFLGAYYAGLNGIIMAAVAFALLHLIWLTLLTSSRAQSCTH